MSSIALLSGCVASTVNTPEGFVGTLPQPTAADVLALENTDALPKPDSRPNAASTAIAAASPAAPSPAVTPAQTASAISAPTQVATTPAATPTARIQAAQSAPVAGQSPAVVPQAQVAATAPPPKPVVTAATSTEPKNRGLLSSLFGAKKTAPTQPIPKTEVAKVETKPQKRVVLASASASGSSAGLPGFDRSKAIGINKSDDAKPVQVASAAGLARLTPNGLKTQHSGVDVKCFKPALVKVLKAAERKFGSPVIVTSGYRSPARNKKIRGAKNSLHIYCSAADVQIKGVSKWTLAKYFRSMSGRGGVGTYCHTKSVHVDIGPKRDWNWRCKRG